MIPLERPLPPNAVRLIRNRVSLLAPQIGRADPLTTLVMKIGFLFLDNIHHLYHSAPIAYELSRSYPELHVEMLVSYAPSIAHLRELGACYPGHRCHLRLLTPPFSYRIAPILRTSFPRKSQVLEKNLDYLSTFDAIIDTEFDGLKLKTRFGLASPKYIRLLHGAGERANVFLEDIKRFDYLLLPGPKVRNLLAEKCLLNPGGFAVIGYPKFDLIQLRSRQKRINFAEDRPIVLYNPHFQKGVSSWHRWGLDVLECFYHSRHFNLIFAPHVMLFERRQKNRLPAKYFRTGNIHVDTGSLASTDMSYTLAADIYLGDVSSQIYEFLCRPRPCFFLNANSVGWRGDPHYVSWTLGTVIDDLAQLETALSQAQQSHAQYLDAQRRVFKAAFDLTDTPSSIRAAQALAAFLGVDSARQG